jgi:hypothetical protein
MRPLFAILCCFLHQYADAQSFFNSLEISVAGAFQKYDDRLFEFPGTVNPSNGTGNYQYALNLHTNLFAHQSWSIHLGIGYTQETNTFRRPFNHCYFREGGCTLVLLRMDKYENALFLFPVDIRYDLAPAKNFGVNFNLQLLPSINFYKSVESSLGAFYEKELFNFYALEVNPGFGFKLFDRFSINLNYRAFQMRQLDKVLFYSVLFENPNDAPKEKYETYNPFKMWLSLRYELFRFKKERAENSQN